MHAPFLAVCSDVHLGNHKRFGGPTEASLNERCRHVLDVFEAAVSEAIAARVKWFIVAGDLFDYARPEPALMRRVQAALNRLDKANIQRVLLVGNHDKTSTAVGDNALAPLHDHAMLIDRPAMLDEPQAELVLIPFMSGPAQDWLRGAVGQALQSSSQNADEHPKPVPRVLIMHMGIKDERTPPWLQDSSGAIHIDTLADICAEYGITQVFAGDWHDRRQWEVNVDDPQTEAKIMQIGALVPTGFDNPGLTGYGTLAWWSRDAGPSFTELAGPRFVKVADRGEALVVAKKAKKAGHRLYLSEQALPGDMADATKTLSKLSTDGDVHAFEVLPDRELAEMEAKKAAARASSAETLDEALDAFVKNMPIADGVSREAVHTRARSYLP